MAAAPDKTALARWHRWQDEVRGLLDEHRVPARDLAPAGWRRVVLFWVFVFRSFVRSRCPARASALAYTSLLALVPLLAVVMSVSTGILKSQGQDPLNKIMDRLVHGVAPALDLKVDGNSDAGRRQVVESIDNFIKKLNTRALGVTGAVALLFVAVSLLRTIEAAFNDIWGVARGRGWMRSIVYYWTAITLGPILVISVMLLTSGSQFAAVQAYLERMPLVGWMVFKAVPLVVVTLGFSVFYALMPNTRVQWSAALVGGAFGGALWQLNNLGSILYVSKVASYRDVYGGLGVLPLFLLGLFVSWVIVLLGAQVAFAWQHRETDAQERLAGAVHQRFRELVALRIMTLVAARFAEGRKGATATDLGVALDVPVRLCRQLLGILADAGLLVESNGRDTTWTPARPIDRITIADILEPVRGRGHEFPTAPDGWHEPVQRALARINAAEAGVAGVTTLAMLLADGPAGGRTPARPAMS